MRKLITLLTVSGLTLAASAQMVQSSKATLKFPSKEDLSISPVYTGIGNQSRNTPTIYNKMSGRNVNTVIGHTLWSNQTNGSVYRRIISYKDGKVSATWTAAFTDYAHNCPDRGTGYNSSDGSAWGALPQARIESYRTGFPSLATAADGSEIILCHLADTGGLSGGFSLSKNLSIGSGTWSTAKVNGSTPLPGYPSPLWPHVAISGDYLIVVSCFTDSSSGIPNHVTISGVRSPMVYSRYQISTKTWQTFSNGSIFNTLPGYDSTLYTMGSGDTYSIDAKDSVIAITAAKPFDDWAMWKSTDNGATWSKKVIMTFPIHKYDFKSDTITRTPCAGDAVHVIVDNSHKIHAFSDRSDVSVDEATRQSNITKNSKGYQYWHTSLAGSGSIGDAILYWNEGLATDSVMIAATSVKVTPTVLAGDSTYAFASGLATWYGITNSTWPSIAIDSVGTMYLVYSAFTLYDDGSNGNYYRDIYVEYSTNSGLTWSNPINVSSGLGISTEQVYPSVARYADSKIHITYLSKKNPGNDQTSATPEVYDINDLVISTVDIKSNTSGTILYVNEVKNDAFSMDQNFPNPFRGITSIPVKLNFTADVTINIVNLVGQTVYTNKFVKAQSGINNFQVDLSNLNSGVYFYTVEADGYKITKRMMVE